MKPILAIFLALFPTLLWARCDTISLSLGEALHIAHQHNHSLAIANLAVEGASAQRAEIESFWFPTINLSGEYIHSLSEIAVESTLGQIEGQIADDIKLIAATNPALGQIVSALEGSTFRLPLMPRNMAMVGLDIGWTVFSGGRRIEASRIADALVELAQNQLATTKEAVSAGVIEAYFTVALAESVVAVRRQASNTLQRHLHQAKLLEQEGMITPTERMIAEVKVQQAATLLSESIANLASANNDLQLILGYDNEQTTTPSTPLFAIENLPSDSYFQAFIQSTPSIATIDNQEEILTGHLAMERSRYLPSVALLGHQQLWSSGLDKNLIPRTFVGVGLSWTLFDGLARESSIRRTKSELRTLNTSRQLATSKLSVAITKLHRLLASQMEQYQSRLSAERLAERLAQSTRKAFGEGMATSMEVVDAEQLHTEAQLATLLTLYTIDTSVATLLSLCGQIEAYLTFVPTTQTSK